MEVQVSNVSVSLDALLPENAERMRAEVARSLGSRSRDIASVRILKRSIDARKKSDVHGVLTAVADVPSCADPADLHPHRGVSVKPYEPSAPWKVPQAAEAFAHSGEERPVVVGAGPAGLFCTLYLARAGVPVTLLERGAAVEERQRIVAMFARPDASSELDCECNIQFGEGGAGTFSDGKLNTGIKSPHIRHVLETFVEHGAPQSILVDAKPHIGTDRLPQVVASMREELIARGCTVLFRTRFDGFETKEGRVTAAIATDTRTGERLVIPTSRIVMACGHSARDTYEMLQEAGLAIERKRFAVGVRIEHPQSAIDEVQYGACAGHPALGAADYKLAVRVPGEAASIEAPDGGTPTRGVYTFCMCPGGEVVAAASEEGGVCVNGMSRYARDGRNANSALLVEVAPEDLPGDDALAGIEMQREMERAAYRAAVEGGGAPYAAPAQTVGDFLAGTCGTPSAWVEPTYPRGVVWTDLHRCLPTFVSHALEQGLPALDRKLHGFAHPQAVMCGVEARSSAPVRLLRDESFCALAIDEAALRFEGLYPTGEGAGYAGGIMSAAVDGLRVAEAIVENVLEGASARNDETSVEHDLAVAVERLRAGEPLLFPTDTVFGLGVSVAHAKSPAVLNILKGRPPEQSIAWLVGSLDDLDRYGTDVPAYARELVREGWPGALTLIVRASDEVPAAFRAPDGTVALRMPASSALRALIGAVGGPLAATSANLTGKPAPRTASEVSDRLRASATLIDLPGQPTGVASVIVDCTGDEPRTVRDRASRAVLDPRS